MPSNEAITFASKIHGFGGPRVREAISQYTLAIEFDAAADEKYKPLVEAAERAVKHFTLPRLLEALARVKEGGK